MRNWHSYTQLTGVFG